MTERRQAILYRMVLPDHTCPYGVRAKRLLEESAYEVQDHVLRSRDEVDAFLEAEAVSTTPQIFIGNQRIGGSEELEAYLIREQAIS
jgi:glutaredoxin 3